MKNLLKLSTLAGLCFGMIVFGACGGGDGGGSGGYTVTVNGTAYSATGTASGSVFATYTVANSLTYYKTGTNTAWLPCDSTTHCGAPSTSTSTSSQ